MNLRDAILEQFRKKPDTELTPGNLIPLLPDFQEGEINNELKVMLTEGLLVSRRVNGVLHISVPEDQDKTYIVCISTQLAQFNPNSVTEGAVKKNCSICGKSVILSVNGQKMLGQNPKVELACMPCYEKIGKENAEVRTGIVPGAFREVMNHIMNEDEE